MDTTSIPFETFILETWKRMTENPVSGDGTGNEKSLLQIAVDKYRTDMLCKVTYELRAKQKQSFIRGEQLMLCTLCNRLLDEMQVAVKAGNRSAMKLQTGTVEWELFALLAGLLDLLEHRFPDYFDPEQETPRIYWQLHYETIAAQFLALQALFREKGVDEVLITVVYIWPRVFADTAAGCPSFHHLRYMNTMLEKLGAISNLEQPVLQPAIVHQLYYINFNAYRFASYCINHMTAELGACASDRQRRALLLRLIKDYNQLTLKKGMAYRADLPSIREKLGNWVLEELTCFNELHLLEQKEQPGDLPAPGEKIRCGLSVAQIACLLKLLVGADAITNKNQLELLRVFAASISTDNAQEVSFNSLRAKFYNIDRNAMLAVRDLLLRMHNFSRKIVP